MNRFEDHSSLTASVTQVKYEDKQNLRFYKDNESSRNGNNPSNILCSDDENENQLEDGNNQYNNKKSIDLYYQAMNQQHQSSHMPYQPKNLGYQGNNNGCQSNNNGYQENNNLYKPNHTIYQVSQNIYQNSINNHNTYQSKQNIFQQNLSNQFNFQFDGVYPNNSESYQSNSGNYQSTSGRFVQNSAIHQQFLNMQQSGPIAKLQNQLLYQQSLMLQPQQQQSKQLVHNQNQNQNQVVPNQANKEEQFEQMRNLCSFYLINSSKFLQDAQKMIFSMNQAKFIEEFFRYLTQCGDTKQKRDFLISIAKTLNRDKLIAKDVFFQG